MKILSRRVRCSAVGSGRRQFPIGVSFGESAADIAVIDFVGEVQYHAAHPYSALRGSGALAAKIEETLAALPLSSRTRVAGIGLAAPNEAGSPHHVRDLLGSDLTDLQASIESAVCTENLIRVDAVMESPKLAE
jgi:predicted NBD/HSP70 family sugar kinase